jgi:L-asparagine transporter-like permease
MIGYPYTSWLGIVAILGIMVTTWWVEGMRVTLEAGLPWLAVLTIAYVIVARRRTRLALAARHIGTAGTPIPTDGIS